MTRRVLSVNFNDNFLVSQEFNGDRHESQMFCLTPISPCWADIIALFKGVKTVRAFESALEKAEELYRYEHIPLRSQPEIPVTEETWQMMDGELELFAQYGEPVFCGL